MKQQCYLAVIYFTWAAYAIGLAFFALRGEYILALVWLAGVPLAQWAYVQVFPAISRYIGYGSVKDQPARTVERGAGKVTLYTALGCPFCPVVKRRLLALQAEMGFDLEEIDVTLKPDVMRRKGIHAVPVVEVADRRLVGHTTSEQLATLVHGLPASTEASTGQPESEWAAFRNEGEVL